MTTDRKQTHKLSELAGQPRLTINTEHERASWKRYGDGYNSIEAWFHTKHKNISLTVFEVAVASEAGKRDVEKRTMVQIDEPGARALYAQLKLMLEGTTD